MALHVVVGSFDRPNMTDASDNFVDSVDPATGKTYTRLQMRYNARKGGEMWQRHFAPDGSIILELVFNPRSKTYRISRGSVEAVLAVNKDHLSHSTLSAIEGWAA